MAYTRDKQGRFVSVNPSGLCVYCGSMTRRRVQGVAVCACHADLPALDPHYAEPNQWLVATGQPCKHASN